MQIPLSLASGAGADQVSTAIAGGRTTKQDGASESFADTFSKLVAMTTPKAVTKPQDEVASSEPAADGAADSDVEDGLVGHESEPAVKVTDPEIDLTHRQTGSEIAVAASDPDESEVQAPESNRPAPPATGHHDPRTPTIDTASTKRSMPTELTQLRVPNATPEPHREARPKKDAARIDGSAMSGNASASPQGGSIPAATRPMIQRDAAARPQDMAIDRPLEPRLAPLSNHSTDPAMPNDQALSNIPAVAQPMFHAQQRILPSGVQLMDRSSTAMRAYGQGRDVQPSGPTQPQLIPTGTGLPKSAASDVLPPTTRPILTTPRQGMAMEPTVARDTGPVEPGQPSPERFTKDQKVIQQPAPQPVPAAVPPTAPSTHATKAAPIAPSLVPPETPEQRTPPPATAQFASVSAIKSSNAAPIQGGPHLSRPDVIATPLPSDSSRVAKGLRTKDPQPTDKPSIPSHVETAIPETDAPETRRRETNPLQKSEVQSNLNVRPDSPRVQRQVRVMQAATSKEPAGAAVPREPLANVDRPVPDGGTGGIGFHPNSGIAPESMIDRASVRPQTPLLAQHVAQQISVSLKHTSDRVTELALDPVELGKVRMTVRAHDQAIVLSVVADRPETADLMRRHIDVLQQEFRSLGYTSVTMEFTAGQGQTAFDQSGAPSGDASGGDAEPDDTMAFDAADAAPAKAARGADGSLDLRL